MELNEQAGNSRADHLKPWQFKKGQSGNPNGRPPGPSLKEYAKKYLASLTEEERLEYLEGIDKKTIWEMAEGKPDTKTDITTDGKPLGVVVLPELEIDNADTLETTDEADTGTKE